MNYIISLFIFLPLFSVTISAFADTSITFPPTRNKVALMRLTDSNNDFDATNLYNILNSKEVESDSFIEKSIAYIDSYGTLSVEINCKKSLDQNSYSKCIVKIYKSHYSNIHSSANYASYGIFDKNEAYRFSKLFIFKNESQIDLYSSSDNKLTIHYNRSDIGDFGLIYSKTR